jgi:hypothetical protein
VAGEIIGRLRGVVSATVLLGPIDAGGRLNAPRRLQATAVIQTANDEPLPRQTVEMIRNVLTSIDAVDPGAITLIDPTSNREYLVAGRPDLEARSADRAREEEYRDRIQEQLRIDGATVFVRIDPVEPHDAAASAPAVARVNQPLGPIGSGSTAADAPAGALALNRGTASPAASPATEGPRPVAEPGRALVLVRVPRSYYLRLYREIHPLDTPTPEDLAPHVARVGEAIRTVVHAVIPPGERGDVKIDRIDDLGADIGLATSREAETSRPAPGWLPVAGGVALAVLTLAALGGGWIATRRPALATTGGRTAPRERPGRGGEAARGGPAEQVRELVRVDPAAAAGVLHRWIVQGGHAR